MEKNEEPQGVPAGEPERTVVVVQSKPPTRTELDTPEPLVQIPSMVARYAAFRQKRLELTLLAVVSASSLFSAWFYVSQTRANEDRSQENRRVASCQAEFDRAIVFNLKNRTDTQAKGPDVTDPLTVALDALLACSAPDK